MRLSHDGIPPQKSQNGHEPRMKLRRVRDIQLRTAAMFDHSTSILMYIIYKIHNIPASAVRVHRWKPPSWKVQA